MRLPTEPPPLKGAAAQYLYCVQQRREQMPGHRSMLFDLTRQEMGSCQPFTAAVIALFHRRFDALITHDLSALLRFPADTHHAWHQQTKTSCPHAR